MISRLTGNIIIKQPPVLVLDVHGVGYDIFAAMSTFYQLPDIGQCVTLLTHFIVRDDAHSLYGFYTEQERRLFRALIRVNGIGPKLALTILSGIEPNSFIDCVRNEDTSRLKNIPGIGKKTAERLIIETRDVIKQFDNANSQAQSSTPLSAHQPLNDAYSALIALGYKPIEVERTLSRIDHTHLSSEAIIKQALTQMMQQQ